MNLVARAARRILGSMADKGEDVVLKWRVVTGAVQDPTTGAWIGGTMTEQTETVRCFVHALDEGAKTKLERYSGVAACDYMVDAPPGIVIETRDELTLVVRGEACGPAKLGNTSGNAYGKQIEYGQGAALYRTLYLQRL